ncbi:MAG TPA: TonB-dependent receptor plug domain-containing protein, partial [Rhodothermales bacterium]|nr:TonB-dependent receptor plug domain-containing protein [Rhodothermales bacterium]
MTMPSSRLQLSALLLWFLGLLPLSAPVLAQQRVAPDTARGRQLQEVIVQGDRPLEAGAATVQRITPAQVARADADAAASLARLIPAAHVPTNSRGETLVYLRNAGERQAAFFLDGALLNVPWDNRVDLSLLPAGVIGAMTVAKGPASIEYGANVLGGVINFTSPAVYGRRTRVQGRLGTQRRLAGSALHTGNTGRISYAASVGYQQQDGIPVSADADLPFSQADADLRTNTDAKIANAFARIAYGLTRTTSVGLTLLHVDAAKGVAPESHLDPSQNAPRYWRYPEWRSTMGVLSGEGRLGIGTAWKASAWASGFGQHIEQYGSAAYETPTARQEDDDRTMGARFTLRQSLGPGAVRLTGNALTSTHAQRDLSLNASGQPTAGVPAMRYRQQLLSGGAVYEADVSRLHIEAGAGYDLMRMPETGDKPARDAFTDYNLTFGARYEAAAWFARGAAGRKTRFPTMRELFGEA